MLRECVIVDGADSQRGAHAQKGWFRNKRLMSC